MKIVEKRGQFFLQNRWTTMGPYPTRQSAMLDRRRIQRRLRQQDIYDLVAMATIVAVGLWLLNVFVW